MDVLYGLHPVEEAIRSASRRFESVSVARERRDERLERLVERCRSAGIPVHFVPRESLSRLAKTEMHQGIVAVLGERRFLAIEDLFTSRQDGPGFLLALDGIEDPQNVGALLRTVEAAGLDGVVLPERRSAPINATVAKASAGASEHVRIARVINLVRSLEQLKQSGYWVVGLDERGTMDYTDYDFNSNCALVLGREGAGLHDLVKKTCDHLLKIPMAGMVSSLNVSVAGAVVIFEAMRQRRSHTTPVKQEQTPRKRKGLGS